MRHRQLSRLAAVFLLLLVAAVVPVFATSATAAPEVNAARVEIATPLSAKLWLPESDAAGDEEVLYGTAEAEPLDESLALDVAAGFTADLDIDATSFDNGRGPLGISLESARGPSGAVIAGNTSPQHHLVGAALDSRHPGTSSEQMRPGTMIPFGFAFTEPGTYCLTLGFSSAMESRGADSSRIRRDSVELRIHVGPGQPNADCGSKLVSSVAPRNSSPGHVVVDRGRGRISARTDRMVAEVAPTVSDLRKGSASEYDASQVIWSAEARRAGRWQIPSTSADSGIDLSKLGPPGRATVLMRLYSGPGTGQFLTSTDPRTPYDLLIPPDRRENDRVIGFDRATPTRESGAAWSFETEGQYCVDVTVYAEHGKEATTSTTRLTFAAGENATEVEPCAEPEETIPTIPIPDDDPDEGEDDSERVIGGDDSLADGKDEAAEDSPGVAEAANGKVVNAVDEGQIPSDDEADDGDQGGLAKPQPAAACMPAPADQEVQIRDGTTVLELAQNKATWRDSRTEPVIHRDPDRVTIGISDESSAIVADGGIEDFAAPGDTIYRTEAGPKDGLPWLGWNFGELPDDASVTWSLDKIEGPGDFAILESNALGETSVRLSAEESADVAGGDSAFGSFAFTEPGYYLAWSRFAIKMPNQAEDSELLVPLRFAVGELGSGTGRNQLLQSFLNSCSDAQFTGRFPAAPAEDRLVPPRPLDGDVPLWKWMLAGAGFAVGLLLAGGVAWILMGGRQEPTR